MRTIVLCAAMLAISCIAHAQNYSATGSASRVITAVTAGGGGYSFNTVGTNGGTVVADSSAGSNQNASTTITVEYSITVADNVAPSTPQGYTTADDTTNCSTSGTNGYGTATAGYTYSPSVNMHSGTSSTWSYGPYSDFTGATVLKVTATAATEAYGYNNGRGSGHADSTATLVVS